MYVCRSLAKYVSSSFAKYVSSSKPTNGNFQSDFCSLAKYVSSSLAMYVDEQSGFCSTTGIYTNKWKFPIILPSQNSSVSFPSFLLSEISPQHVQKPAFIDSKTGKSITYQDLRSLSIAISHSLYSLGVKKGDVVLVVSSNSIYFPVLFLGIMSLGAIFTTANPLNTKQELEIQIQDSNPILGFTTLELCSKLDGLISRPIMIIEEFIGELFNHPNKLLLHSYPLEFTVIQEDTAALLYSSGTTGKSKGVMCTHRCLVSQSSMLRHTWDIDDDASNNVYMCVIPLFHIFGIMTLICEALAVRSTVVILKKYSMEEMLAGIKKYKVTKLPVAPPVVVQLVKLQEEEDQMKGKKQLGSLKQLICSGAPLGREYSERFAKVNPQVRLCQYYGSTETGLVALSCNDVVEDIESNVSVGNLAPSIEAKILNVETQEPQPPLSFGELCVRGPAMMKGYYKNQEATSLALDKEGWLHTGDLCFIDKFGQLHIVDRIKEFIKYKGYQVAPAELEEKLSTHPEIKDVAVTSYPDEVAGEIPMACVVRKDRSKITKEEIIAFIANKVAPYKKIRKVVFVESIPRSAAGKILRRQLKAAHQQQKISSNL